MHYYTHVLATQALCAAAHRAYVGLHGAHVKLHNAYAELHEAYVALHRANVGLHEAFVELDRVFVTPCKRCTGRSGPTATRGNYFTAGYKHCLSTNTFD